MESKSFKVCIICCYSYRVDIGVKSVKPPQCSRILSKFCSDLNEGDEAWRVNTDSPSSTQKRSRKDDNAGDTDKTKVKRGRGRSYSNKRKMEEVKRPSSESDETSVVEKLSVCSDCLSMFGKVSKARANAGKVEGRVRKLQQRILTELKELKEEMAHVYMEIKRVEEVMSCADAGCLQALAEKGRDTEVNEIIAFRENILRVSRSLSTYQTELAAKLLTSHSDNISTTVKVIKMEKVQPDISEPAPAPAQVNFHEHLKIESSDTRINEADPMDLFVQQPIPAILQPCASDNETNSGAAPPLELWNPEDSNGEDVPGEEFTDVGNCSSNEDQEWVVPSMKKRKAGTSSKKKAGQKRRRRIVPVKKSKKLSALPPDIDISGMSPWRREIVIRVYRRLKKYSQDKSEEDYNDDDDKFLLKFPMEYNPLTGLLSVGDINDLIINDEENCLQCSKCPFRASDGKFKSSSAAEMGLFSHILGTHMEAFICKFCGQKFSGMKRYNRHLKVHRDPNLFKCDKCDKQLMSQDSFKQHQWMHMTPEEKAESMRLGKLKCKWNKDPNRKYQCPTCGKSYSSKSNLNMHEKGAHSGRKDHVCAKCGKEFAFYTSYYIHVRASCLDDDHPKLECSFCTAADPNNKRLFKNAGTLKTHLRRNHSKDAIEKNFVCELCSRRFSSTATLRNHLKKHVDQPRNIVCPVGCGATFADRRHWHTHQSHCKGPGTRVRALRSDRLSERTSDEAKRKLEHLVRRVKMGDT